MNPIGFPRKLSLSTHLPETAEEDELLQTVAGYTVRFYGQFQSWFRGRGSGRQGSLIRPFKGNIRGLLRPIFRITLKAILGLLGLILALFWFERP